MVRSYYSDTYLTSNVFYSETSKFWGLSIAAILSVRYLDVSVRGGFACLIFLHEYLHVENDS